MAAEITINFRDMAMFVLGRSGVTVVFPAIGHQTRITRSANWDDTLVDLSQGFELEVFEDGQPMAATPTAGPSGVYAVELSWAARQPVLVPPTLLSGPVPASLNGRALLRGGYLLDEPSQIKGGQWANTEWEFKHGGRHLATECMTFRFEAKDAKYTLEGAGDSIPLEPGQELFVWNGDREVTSDDKRPLADLPEFREFGTLTGVDSGIPKLVENQNQTMGWRTYEDRPCVDTYCFLI